MFRVDTKKEKKKKLVEMDMVVFTNDLIGGQHANLAFFTGWLAGLRTLLGIWTLYFDRKFEIKTFEIGQTVTE